MPSDWTLHNIRIAEKCRSACPDDLLPLYDEVIALAKEPASEEKAKAFFELEKRARAATEKKEMHQGRFYSAMFEIISVCLYKELRQTETVQAVMHDEF